MMMMNIPQNYYYYSIVPVSTRVLLKHNQYLTYTQSQCKQTLPKLFTVIISTIYYHHKTFHLNFRKLFDFIISYLSLPFSLTHLAHSKRRPTPFLFVYR